MSSYSIQFYSQPAWNTQWVWKIVCVWHRFHRPSAFTPGQVQVEHTKPMMHRISSLSTFICHMGLLSSCTFEIQQPCQVYSNHWGSVSSRAVLPMFVQNSLWNKQQPVPTSLQLLIDLSLFPTGQWPAKKVVRKLCSLSC